MFMKLPYFMRARFSSLGVVLQGTEVTFNIAPIVSFEVVLHHGPP